MVERDLRTRAEWLSGWDDTDGIVSVWAEPDGRAFVWRRLLTPGGPSRLVREDVRFRPWIIVAAITDFAHLGDRLKREGDGPLRPGGVTFEELEGDGALRYVVRGDDGRALTAALLHGASLRTGRPIHHVRELGQGAVLAPPPEEQYLMASGRTYFRGLAFDDLERMQVDLETTGLDPEVSRIFLVAVRDPQGKASCLQIDTALAASNADAAEAKLLHELVATVRAFDPDVIENHNLHGFDLPFLARRARRVGVPLALGRAGLPGLRPRPAARGASLGGSRGADGERSESADAMRRTRFTVPGRELIDTLDAVRRHDFSARDLPGHGLKVVAKHMGLAREDREQIPGAQIYEVFTTDPARVRRYAEDDVHEAAGLARLLGGAAFALAKMAPRRYERLADAGAATGIIDPMLVRAYLRSKSAIPAHEEGDGTPHTGAALHLFATGVAKNIVKADVASLYPSLMREYRIGPSRDRLHVMLSLVDSLVEQRLAAKALGRAAPKGSPERHTHEAMSAAMKLVINSAYGYLGAVGLTRFADVHAANEVTRRGREMLGLICRALDARGVTLLEADTDGVYFAVGDGVSEAEERRIVAEVAALLPAQVHLEFDGRYKAMLSHEPKNYALLPYDGQGPLVLRGVAFRSSRAEPFGEEFLRRALLALLSYDLVGVREAYVATVMDLRKRTMPTAKVAARLRLTKSPRQYQGVRARRRELPYEAMLASGRADWSVGEKVRVYRATGGRARVLVEDDDVTASAADRDPRDYDVELYVRLLRESFAVRLVRGVAREHYESIVADPERPMLFAASLVGAKPVLTRILAVDSDADDGA